MNHCGCDNIMGNIGDIRIAKYIDVYNDPDEGSCYRLYRTPGCRGSSGCQATKKAKIYPIRREGFWPFVVASQ